MEVKYNIPIQVNKRQYDHISKNYSWACAYRTDNTGSLFIKLLMPKMDTHISKILKKLK